MNIPPPRPFPSERLHPNDVQAVYEEGMKALSEIKERINSGECTPEQEIRLRVAYDALYRHTMVLASSMASSEEAQRVFDAIEIANNAIASFEMGPVRIDVDADIADAYLGRNPADFTSRDSEERVPGPPSRYLPGHLTEKWLKDNYANGSELVRAFEDDPDAFGRAWRELDSEERQLAMQALQQEIALNNQLTQMLTSLSKSTHDTMMAVARNLQV